MIQFLTDFNQKTNPANGGVGFIRVRDKELLLGIKRNSLSAYCEGYARGGAKGIERCGYLRWQDVNTG